MLKQFTIASYPNMKQDERNRLHRKMHSMAYPELHENQKPLTMEQAVNLMGAFNGRK